MEWDFRDLATGVQLDPKEGMTSIIEINSEHRVRFLMRTSKGNLILRFLPLRMKRVIDSVRHTIYPKTMELEDEVRNLSPYVMGPPEEWDQEKAARIREIGAVLQLTDMYALGVIEAPALADMDDYEALLGMLTEDERMTLDLAVRALSSPVDPKHVDTTAMEIAKANGIQLMDADMLASLTVSQAAVYMNMIRREQERIRRMSSGGKHVVP